MPQPTEQLTEEVIVHFAASLRYVARRAKALERAAKEGGGGGGAKGRGGDNGGVGPNWEVSKDVELGASAGSGEGGVICDDDEGEMTMGDPTQAAARRLQAAGGTAAEAGGVRAGGNAGNAGDVADDGVEGDAENPMEAEWGWSSLVSQAAVPAMLPPLMRVWWIAARVDGRCGQLLGHAVAKGLPWVRAWMVSLVVWKGTDCVTEVSSCATCVQPPSQTPKHRPQPEPQCGLDPNTQIPTPGPGTQHPTPNTQHPTSQHPNTPSPDPGAGSIPC